MVRKVVRISSVTFWVGGVAGRGRRMSRRWQLRLYHRLHGHTSSAIAAEAGEHWYVAALIAI